MKKLTALIATLAMLITMTGCSTKNENTLKNQSVTNPFESIGTINGYDYPKFLNTDWGMSPEDTLEALGLTLNDVEVVPVNQELLENSDNKGDVISNGELTYKATIKINDIPTKVRLVFSTQETVTHDPVVGLYFVSVSTNDDKLIKLAESAKAMIEASDTYIGQFEAFEFIEKTNMINAFATQYDAIFADNPTMPRGDIAEYLKQDCEAKPLKDMNILSSQETRDGESAIQYDQLFLARYKYFANN